MSDIRNRIRRLHRGGVLAFAGAAMIASWLALASCRGPREAAPAAASDAVVHLLDRIADASIEAVHARDLRGEFGEPTAAATIRAYANCCRLQ